MLLASSITELKILQVTASEHKFTGSMTKTVAISVSESANIMTAKFIKVQKAMEQWVMEPT